MEQKTFKVYFEGFFYCYADSAEEAETKKPTDDCVSFIESWNTGHDKCYVDDMLEANYKIWEENYK